MHLCIDAWLERKDPHIRLIDRQSGQEILRLEPEQVRHLMESGEICLDDLQNGASLCTELLQLIEQTPVRRVPIQIHAPAYVWRLKSASRSSSYAWSA